MDPTHLTQGADSPFLPGTKIQYAFDSTSLGMLKTCPRLYQYTMIDGWASPVESIHLRFGIEYHSALQDYDLHRAQGHDHETSLRLVVRNLLISSADWNPNRDTKAGKYKNRDTLVALVVGYLDHFVDDPAQTYIMENGRPAVELSFRFELDFHPIVDVGQPYLLSGHLDRVVEFNGALFVMDHKTTTTTPGQYYFHQYEPNNQMTLYTIGGQVVLNSPIKGVIISAAQILLTEPNRYIRGFTFRTQDQLEEWMTDLRVLLTNNEAYAEAGYWPMNDTACDKFGGCRFREVCSKSPDVREMFLKTDFIKLEEGDRWNPLKSR